MSVRRLLAFGLLFPSFFCWAKPYPVSYGSQELSVLSHKQQSLEERKALILDDFAQRISPEFRIPKDLKSRVAFWFDVYTLYGSNHYVIHHSRYPWIVFEVVDTTSLVESGKGPQWLRRQRAQKFAQSRKNHIRQILADLIRNPSRLKTPEHRRIRQVMQQAPGTSLKAKLRLALASIRTQLGQKDFFHNGLEQSSYYLPHMEEEFESQGLPKELTRMPFVESSFNVKAKSRVGASGIWQIMPRTGKAYLTVNQFVDERNNPIKATKAAGKLLKSYFRALKTWPLAITSYNHGIGNIRKAMRAARSAHLATIINRYHRGDFKFASSNFFSCFLAALHAEKYHELMFNDIERLPKQNFVITQLKRPVRAKTLIRDHHLSQEQFVRFNLDLVHAVEKNSLLPRGLRVFLPGGLDKTLAVNEIQKVRL